MVTITILNCGSSCLSQVEELKAKSHSAYDYSNEIDHLHNRAVQYWREACDILEKFQRYRYQNDFVSRNLM